jgi:hypothetical protein
MPACTQPQQAKALLICPNKNQNYILILIFIKSWLQGFSVKISGSAANREEERKEHEMTIEQAAQWGIENLETR